MDQQGDGGVEEGADSPDECQQGQGQQPHGGEEQAVVQQWEEEEDEFLKLLELAESEADGDGGQQEEDGQEQEQREADAPAKQQQQHGWQDVVPDEGSCMGKPSQEGEELSWRMPKGGQGQQQGQARKKRKKPMAWVQTTLAWKW